MLSLNFMKLLVTVLILLPLVVRAQPDSTLIINETKAFQQELNKEYKDKSSSPLLPASLKKFKGHDFFPIDVQYAVIAHLTLTPNTPFQPMAATGPIINDYRTYAVAKFELNGLPLELTLYQSKELMTRPGYEDYLFLPFADETSGIETYGGGRYLEVRIPKEGDTVLLNFNKSYNPYCAYNPRYSCPLIPTNNHLPVAVKAGVRMENK